MTFSVKCRKLVTYIKMRKYEKYSMLHTEMVMNCYQQPRLVASVV